MKLQDMAHRAPIDDDLYRTVSLAEARCAMDEQQIARLPSGFWCPMVSGMDIGMVFPDRLPLDYDGQAIWPCCTASSDEMEGLAQAIGLPETLEVELWGGVFDFQMQCFQLTVPEEARHIAAFIYDPQHTLKVGLSAFMLKYADRVRPMICQAISSCQTGQEGFFLVRQLDEGDEALEELLARQGAEYRKWRQDAAKILRSTPEQRKHCRATMATLMQWAELLGWGWRPLADYALVYLIGGDGKAEEEFFSYTQLDVDALRDLICIAEEATLKYGIGEPKRGL